MWKWVKSMVYHGAHRRHMAQPRSPFRWASREAQDESVPVTRKEEGDDRESTYTDLQTLQSTARWCCDGRQDHLHGCSAPHERTMAQGRPLLVFQGCGRPALGRATHRALTYFSAGLPCIQFDPNPNLVRAPSTMPRRYTMQRPGGPQQGHSAAAFPPMPDMSTCPEG